MFYPNNPLKPEQPKLIQEEDPLPFPEPLGAAPAPEDLAQEVNVQHEIKRKLTPILLARQSKLQALRQIIRSQQADSLTDVSSIPGSAHTPPFVDIPLDATIHPDDPRLQRHGTSSANSTPSSVGSFVVVGENGVVKTPSPEPWAQYLSNQATNAAQYVRGIKFPGFS